MSESLGNIHRAPLLGTLRRQAQDSLLYKLDFIWLE
jgi:hypothetical protein